MALIETLGDVIERNEKYLPRQIFVSCSGHDRTFAEHALRVRQLGDALHGGGARKQDRVAMLSMNGPEYPEVYSLAELCGFILVKVNFRLSASEVEWILNDSQPSVLIFEERYTEAVDSIRDRLQTITQYVCIGTLSLSWAVNYESFLASGNSAGPPFRSSKDDYVSITYTSGTTGRPKGVLHKHKQLLALGLTQAIEYGSAIGTTALIILPMFHQGAHTLYLAQMLRGGRIIVHRRFEPEAALAAIQAERIMISGLVPTMLQAMLDVPNIGQYDFSSLRSIISLGAVMPLPLLRRAVQTFGPIFVNGYGQTEGGNTMLRRQYLVLEGTEDELRRMGSVGHPLMHTDLRIIDGDGSDLPPGGIGEICVKSDQIMEGYWNNHAATIEVLRDGWLLTGDLGYVDADGFLYVLDRKRDLIISGGENIYSAEVERMLHEHPEIHEAAVIGVPDEKWGESVRAVIVLKPKAVATEADVLAFGRSMIAAYKCPKSVIIVDELPHVPTGKVNKIALRKLYGATTSAGTG